MDLTLSQRFAIQLARRRVELQRNNAGDDRSPAAALDMAIGPSEIDDGSVKADGSSDSTRDIYHIAFLLRQRLVSDVVPLIVHHAGLFRRSSCSASQEKRISGSQSPYTYLFLEIPNSARLLHPVEKVVFTIDSHDQGYASNPDAGNWTWFTAFVFSADEPLEPDWIPGRSGPADARTISEGERLLVQNQIACKSAKTKIVEWQRNSSNNEESEWVSNLKAGDMIGVRAWARFPEWVNYVYSAQLDMYTTAVVA